MNRVTIPMTELDVSVLSYGTADLGDHMSDREVSELLNLYRDAGGNFLDTAHVYACWSTAGDGSSERAIARYRKANPGGDLVVATKGGHPGLPGYRQVDRYLDPGRVRADIEDSLGRLEADCIDLFYLHRDDTRCSVAEIIQMLNEEVSRGTIRYIAASNWSVDRLEAANQYARDSGYQGFVASEIEFSLAWRPAAKPQPTGDQTIVAQRQDLEFHRRTGLPLCAFSAAAQGYFAREPGPGKMHNPVNEIRHTRVSKMAHEKQATPTQIALAWLLHQEFPCHPITGTVSPDHLKENIRATSVELIPEEVVWLTSGEESTDQM